MNFRFTIVDTSLNRVEFRWKWHKFLEFSFLLGGILCLLVLLFGIAVVFGLITSKSVATTWFAAMAVLGLLAWVVIIIWVAAASPDRNWLAAALERADRRLLDRLNTLLFLERHRGDSRVESFSLRIARQAHEVLRKKGGPTPFPAGRPLRFFLCLMLAATVTVCFYQVYSPWSRLQLADKAGAANAAAAEKPLELALPGTNIVEQNQAWGEVRITDPGADLKVTKVDVVPLQIEAAANEPLKKVSWFSTVNDTAETLHELPPPNEPRYAVYQPTLYLDELRLSDWDLMTYYAKANAEKDRSFASGVYFLEVRPFREDILKMPGGENGKAYQCLNEMTALINRQQHVIRQTHQFIQTPQEQENLQAQDRKKLSEAETDLAESAEHLYAKMVSTMEHAPIGEALDNLAKAEKSLEQAGKQLQTNNMPEAQSKERSALTDLVAARKIFQKAVSQNPKAFEDKDEEQSPIADSNKKLNEMAEFRNEAKASQDFVKKSLEQQRSIEQRANAASRAEYPNLSAQERQLESSLREFQEQHPKVFQGATNESADAHLAMSKAADSLEKKSSDSRAATHEATSQLEKLSQATGRKSAAHQLADAYRLKQMLDQEIQTLAKYTNGDGTVSEADLQKTVSASKETINQLKNAAEQEPTRDDFDKPLRESLSGNNKVDLDTKLNQLQQAQDAASKQERAGVAREALSKVSKAFTDSEPKAMQMAQKGDSLKPGQGDSFNVGLAELESLIKQLERQKISPEEQGKQGQEALFNLQTGLRSLHGSNEQGEQILLKLEQTLKAEALDVADLKKLMDQLAHFSVETSEKSARKDDKPEVTNIDPSRLPPAYRGRIQKYFQKLSEK